MTQADHDLDTAQILIAAGRFAWASYAAAQAAEKAIKAMLIAWGADLGEGEKAKPWKVHELSKLFHAFRSLPRNQQLADALTILPTHDQGARYPALLTDVPPCTSYTQSTAENAIELATATVGYAKQLVPAIERSVRELELVAAAAIGTLPPP